MIVINYKGVSNFTFVYCLPDHYEVLRVNNNQNLETRVVLLVIAKTMYIICRTIVPSPDVLVYLI